MPFDQTDQERLPSENLVRAHEILSRGFWCQNAWRRRSRDGRMLGCATEVLHEVIFGKSWLAVTEPINRREIGAYRAMVCERPEFVIVNDLIPDLSLGTVHHDALGRPISFNDHDAIGRLIYFNDDDDTDLRRVLQLFSDAIGVARMIEADALQLAKSRGLV